MALSTPYGTTTIPGTASGAGSDQRWSRSFRLGRAMRHLVPAQFALAIALMAGFDLFERWLGGGSGMMMAVFGLPAFAISTLAFVLWTLVPPRRLHALFAGLAALGAYLAASPHLGHAGRWMFFESRRTRLEALARDVVAYGRIAQLSDGYRDYKELNHQLVAYAPSEVDTSSALGGRARRPLQEVLAEQGIASERYEEFRQRLHDVRLIMLDVQPGYVAFEYDGLVDNLEGYLLVRPGGAPPALGSKLLGTDLVVLEPLGGGWYRWATT
jgi:hypothetical protein